MEGSEAQQDGNGVEEPGENWLFWAYFLVVAAALLAGAMTLIDSLHAEFRLDAGDFQWFAALYAVALALERLVEPLMKFAGGEKTETAKAKVAETKRALVAGEQAQGSPPQTPAEKAKKADDADQTLDMWQKGRAIWAWAIASAGGLVLSAAFGFGILESLGTFGSGAKSDPTDATRVLDVLVTGFAIGAGTKPLHDLVSRVESAKKKADPSTQTAAQAISGTQ